MPSSFSGNLNEFHLGKLHPDRRFDCQIHNVAPFTHASSTVCTRLHFICFHSLMACCRHVRRISFLSLRFFPFLPPPLLLLLRPAASLAPSFGEGKGLRWPCDPNLTWDRWSSLSPAPPLTRSLPFLSSVLLRSPILSSLNDVFVRAVTNQTPSNFFPGTHRWGFGVARWISERVLCLLCKYWCQLQRACRSAAPKDDAGETEQLWSVAPNTKECTTTTPYLASLCLLFSFSACSLIGNHAQCM